MVTPSPSTVKAKRQQGTLSDFFFPEKLAQGSSLRLRNFYNIAKWRLKYLTGHPGTLRQVALLRDAVVIYRM